MRSVREQTKSSALWCRKLRSLAEASPVDLALGGEHLISFPLIEVLAARHPGLRVVVLDAHHDAYDYPLLTHYSLFHYTQTELTVPTMMLGVRHEIEQATPGLHIVSADALRSTGVQHACRAICDFVAGGPFYFSIDLDVVDPGELAAVSDPVPGGIAISELVEIARGALACAPIAVDLVEYNPLRDPMGEWLDRLTPVFEELACWLG
jgi:arginase family enzyme